MRLLLGICLLVLLTAAESHAARIVEGVVRAVYDGDTILLVTHDASRVKTRLYGIDAPETAKPDQPGQPFGEAAKRALFSKIMGRTVSAEVVNVDQYQRAVAVIRYADRDINREMVAEGLAWAYRQFLRGPYASEYLGAESSARSRRSGLWRDVNPQPPWEFRRALRGGQRPDRQR
jgi:micrococcal nuclease